MHDDDPDEGPADGPADRDPSDATGVGAEDGRAEYALPPGVPALQVIGQPIHQAPAVSRRTFLALVIGTSIGAGALGWGLAYARNRTRPEADVPETRKPEPDPRVQKMVAGARTAADGPIENLLNTYFHFIWLVEHHGEDDPRLWNGIERLATWAVIHRGSRGTKIARTLVSSFARRPPPPRLNETRLRLDQLITESSRDRRRP